MKKFLYAFFAIAVALGSVALNSNASADTIVSRVDMIPGASADFTTPEGNSGNVDIGYVYAQNKLSYCVEPAKEIYDGTNLEESSFLDETLREKLSVISYNGYNDTNRKSEKWYMATQLYMWEELGYTLTKIYGFDDYASYRSQIKNNIDTYHKLPSFVNQNITLKKGEAVSLNDTNKVLHTFSNIVNNGKATMHVNGDSMSLETDSNAYEEGTINISKFLPEQLGLPIVYRGKGDSSVQQILYPHIAENVSGQFSYRIQPYGYARLDKYGQILTTLEKEETDNGIVEHPVYENSKLKNVKVGLYAREDVKDVWGKVVYAKNTKVDELISGVKETSIKLLAGKYYMKEIEGVDGYLIDEKEYDFVISSSKQDMSEEVVKIYNERSKVRLKLHKNMEEGSLLDLSEAYRDVVFGIYAKEDIYNANKEKVIVKDALVYTSGINAEGYLSEDADLPLGSYYLKELKTNEHYVLDENSYPFEVKANGKEIIDVVIGNGELENKLHRNELTIYKIDGEDKTPLSARFVLYDEKMNEIEEFVTDKNGKYVFEDLIDGTYFLQEIEAPKGYKLNTKLHKINLMEDIVYEMENDKLPVEKASSVDTNDQANHKPMEIMMLGSMGAIYSLLLRKMKI